MNTAPLQIQQQAPEGPARPDVQQAWDSSDIELQASVLFALNAASYPGKSRNN